MSIFTQVEQTVSDYNVLWAAFCSSAQAAADATAAVAARIAADRAQVDERTAALTAQSRDQARPEVVCKLAQQDLEKLRTRTFEPSADEAAAFAAALEDARSSLRDAVTVRGQLKNLFAEASRELETLIVGTLGDQIRDAELASRRLDSEQKTFDHLGKTGRPSGMS